MMEMDDDAMLIARMMQEEEDRAEAERIQNEIYAGTRPPTA